MLHFIVVLNYQKETCHVGMDIFASPVLASTSWRAQCYGSGTRIAKLFPSRLNFEVSLLHEFRRTKIASSVRPPARPYVARTSSLVPPPSRLRPSVASVRPSIGFIGAESGGFGHKIQRRRCQKDDDGGDSDDDDGRRETL